MRMFWNGIIGLIQAAQQEVKNPLIGNPCPLPVYQWWQSYPPVGTFIGILGGLGVIVPWLFRPPEKMGRTEKAIWTFVMFSLVWLELRSLYLDRDAHDAEQAHARCEQLQNFNQIAQGISNAIRQSQEQFDATMIGLKTTIQLTDHSISRVNEAIRTSTGGDSFCYVSFGNLTDAGALRVATPGGSFRYPLHNVTVHFVDQDDPTAGPLSGEQYQIGDISDPHVAESLPPISLMKRKRWNFLIEFTALNGMWYEQAKLRKVDAMWEVAVKVTKWVPVGDKKPMQVRTIFESVSKNYPRTNGEVD